MALSQKGIHYERRSELDPIVRQALDSIASQLQAGLKQVNATPSGHTAAPPDINALNVIGQDGIFDVQIKDNNAVNRGIEYFVEYSLTPGFERPVVIHLGPARNWRGALGAQQLYWRAYSQYPTSAPSARIHFGGVANPTLVQGGGALLGPNPLPSSGSGTAPSNGLSGGQGYGMEPVRGSSKFPPA